MTASADPIEPITSFSEQAAAAARAEGRPIPDFFIVGHPKSGTTALYEMLRSHPQIFMPALKETLFFDRDELHPAMNGKRTHPQSLEEYLALFEPARAGQLKGEASPSYLRSRLAAERIAVLQPQARIIAILREPASYLRSLHLELLQDHVETEKDLRRAIEREEREAPVKQTLRYAADRVDYAAQVRRYHETFGRDRVLVLIYDDFRADNEATLRGVLRFLEVDEDAPLDSSEANPTVMVRSPRMYSLLRSVYLGRTPATRPIKAAIKAITPRRLRHRSLRAVRERVIFGGPPEPDQELMLELRRRYRPAVEAAGDYLGRDLVRLWGYDRLD
jgi:Sulfotransferase family